jgi:hypothetical protein
VDDFFSTEFRKVAAPVCHPSVVRGAAMANAESSENTGTAGRLNNGAYEGIRISGYWKIDVHNRDGSLARHVEFENSLETGL